MGLFHIGPVTIYSSNVGKATHYAEPPRWISKELMQNQQSLGTYGVLQNTHKAYTETKDLVL